MRLKESNLHSVTSTSIIAWIMIGFSFWMWFFSNGGAEHFGKLRYCAYIIALVGYWLQADRVSINALENTTNIKKQSCLSDFPNKQHIYLNKPKKPQPATRFSRNFTKKTSPKSRIISGLGNCGCLYLQHIREQPSVSRSLFLQSSKTDICRRLPPIGMLSQPLATKLAWRPPNKYIYSKRPVIYAKQTKK